MVGHYVSPMKPSIVTQGSLLKQNKSNLLPQPTMDRTANWIVGNNWKWTPGTLMRCGWMDALGKDTRNQTRTGQLYKRQINKSSDVYKCSNLSSQDQGDKRTQTHTHTHTHMHAHIRLYHLKAYDSLWLYTNPLGSQWVEKNERERETYRCRWRVKPDWGRKGGVWGLKIGQRRIWHVTIAWIALPLTLQPVGRGGLVGRTTQRTDRTKHSPMTNEHPT